MTRWIKTPPHRTDGDGWYQITAPHFCAGMLVKDGVIVRAAPIIKWAVNRTWPQLTHYLRRKRWKWRALDGSMD